MKFIKKHEYLLLLLIVALDLGSKYLAESKLLLGSKVEIIPDLFYLTLSYNRGAAWGIMAGNMQLFYVISIAVLIILTYLLYINQYKKWDFRLPIIMIIGGTIGNFFDRCVYARVRDFLDFYIFGYDYPVFNIADSFLCIGCFLLIIYILRHPEEN